jgi:hypothetical protein
MDIYTFAELTIYYTNRGSDDGVRCRVQISEDHCTVVFDQVEGTDKQVSVATWSGKGVNGHYELSGEVSGRNKAKCRATLHRFPGATVLDGFWQENALTGMWRIKLSNKLEN